MQPLQLMPRRAVQPSARPPLQILVAEDDRDMRELLEALLEEDGHEVTGVADGLALIRAVQHAARVRLPYDLVVTDVRMPGWNGLEALDFLGKNGGRPPVIVMTAFGDARLHEVAASLGAAMVLDKTFDLDELREAIASVARASRAR